MDDCLYLVMMLDELFKMDYSIKAWGHYYDIIIGLKLPEIYFLVLIQIHVSGIKYLFGYRLLFYLYYTPIVHIIILNIELIIV